MTIIFARGLKVSRDLVNDLLLSNHIDPIEGDRLRGNQPQIIADFFRSQGIDWKFEIFIPSLRDFDWSPYIYICDYWDFILSQKRVDLEGATPAALESLRQLLGVESSAASYVLSCDGVPWIPPILTKRFEPPITCDVCQEVFTNEPGQAWRDRQQHRRKIHQSSEGESPLPDC